ncbi:MAG: hypothetical protein ACKOPT_12965 [Cyanobium sp.]
MTTPTLHHQEQAAGFGGDLPRQAASSSPRPRLQALGRPFPGACHQRSLLGAMEELTTAVRLLTTALVGEAPGEQAPIGFPDPLEDEGMHGSPAPCNSPLPLQQEPNYELANASQIVADATELWDTPWEALSVVELRALLRDLPIDRSALPAPIEFLRRHELLDALLHLPAITW